MFDDMDSVRCNWCDWYGEVVKGSEVCPSCNENEYLSDYKGATNV
jgi:rubrerythrin